MTVKSVVRRNGTRNHLTRPLSLELEGSYLSVFKRLISLIAARSDRAFSLHCLASMRSVLSRVACSAALLLLVTVSNASASVTVQNAVKTSASSVTTATIVSFNPGGASHRVLVVGLTFGQGAPTGIAVTYGGLAIFPMAGT